MAGMEDILARLRLNDSRKNTPTEAEAAKAALDDSALATLLSNMNDPSKAFKKEEKDCKDVSNNIKQAECSSGSDQATTDSYGVVSCSGSQESDPVNLESAEMIRMKRELEAAKSVISRQEQELAESRTLKHTMDQAMGTPSEIDFAGAGEISEQTINHLQSAFNATARPFTSRTTGWRSQDDNRSDHSDLSVGSFPPRATWNQQPLPVLSNIPELSTTTMMGNPRDARLSGQAYGGMYGNPSTANAQLGANRVFSGSSSNGLGYDQPLGNDLSLYNTNPGLRRNMPPPYRTGSTLSDPLTPFGSLPAVSNMTSPPLSPLDAPGQYGFAPRGLGLQPSPLTPNFPNGPMQGLGSQWPMTVSLSPPSPEIS